MLDIKDYGWWYWLASTICLWLTVSFFSDAYYWALVIGVIQLFHFSFKEGGVFAFPVQIRIGYLAFLLLALPEGYEWVLWIPAIGTMARVLFGYCIMARMLMLLPNNRHVKLSWRFIKEAFLTPPVRGNIMHGLPSLTIA